MNAVHELLSRRPDIELRFVRNRPSGRVHVAVPVDPDIEPEIIPWDSLDTEGKAQTVIGMVRQRTSTLCGFTATVYHDNSRGDEIVDTFADTDLCWSCHRALGPEHQERAFRHPQPRKQRQA